MNEAREQEEFERIREQTRFKATPIKHYKNVEMVERKELTIPQAPKFETDKRAEIKKTTIWTVHDSLKRLKWHAK